MNNSSVNIRLARPRRLKLVDTGRTERIIHIHKYNKKYPVNYALAMYKKGKYRNHQMIADYIRNYGTKKGVHITETKVYTHEVVRPRDRVRSSTADRRRNKL